MGDTWTELLSLYSLQLKCERWKSVLLLRSLLSVFIADALFMQQGITSKTKPLKIVSRKLKDLECAELDCLNARFGFALANIGDVDRDGFDGQYHQLFHSVMNVTCVFIVFQSVSVLLDY